MSKRINIRCVGSPINYIKELKLLNKKFVLQETMSTQVIITDKYKRIYCKDSTFLSKYEMMLQKQIAKDIRDTTKDKKIIKIPKNKVNYFNFNKSLKEMTKLLGEIVSLKNVIEMDITMAYYQVCYNLGYMSEKMYNKCKNIPKHMRLRLLGSIATRKTIMQYEGDTLIDIKIKQDDKMRDIWFNICYNTDQIIVECADAIQDYFLFYWVDGIYFKKDDKIEKDFLQPSVQVVEYIFDKNNLEYKTKNIDELIIINKNNTIYLQLYNNEKLKSRFNIKRNKINKYYLEDEQGFQQTILEEHI